MTRHENVSIDDQNQLSDIISEPYQTNTRIEFDDREFQMRIVIVRRYIKGLGYRIEVRKITC